MALPPPHPPLPSLPLPPPLPSLPPLTTHHLPPAAAFPLPSHYYTHHPTLPSSLNISLPPQYLSGPRFGYFPSQPPISFPSATYQFLTSQQKTPHPLTLYPHYPDYPYRNHLPRQPNHTHRGDTFPKGF
jgi:hypothetical protein